MKKLGKTKNKNPSGSEETVWAIVHKSSQGSSAIVGF